VQVRDDLERILRAWNQYELKRSAPAIIDYDCMPGPSPVAGRSLDRLSAYRELSELHDAAAREESARVRDRIGAHLAYLRCLLGERPALADYIPATQGCQARGWPEDYIQALGETARTHLDAMGVPWGTGTRNELQDVEQLIDPGEAPDAIRAAAAELEPAVREAAGTSAPYTLAIETTTVNAYWAYWTDGSGQNVRLRLNLKEAQFTRVQARQFALHEVLGHGLQGASYSSRCMTEPVPWVRVLSVHAQQQVLLEGLAQALPLFVSPNDQLLATRVRLDHYTQLVRATVHLALNAGFTITECADYAREHVPYWQNEYIADLLSDRGADPLLRTYLWSYPAGIDWFVSLAQSDSGAADTVLRAAYRDPLTPDDLTALWPEGPTFGGPGRQSSLL
jgi:hypothetical protein